MKRNSYYSHNNTQSQPEKPIVVYPFKLAFESEGYVVWAGSENQAKSVISSWRRKHKASTFCTFIKKITEDEMNRYGAEKPTHQHLAAYQLKGSKAIHINLQA